MNILFADTNKEVIDALYKNFSSLEAQHKFNYYNGSIFDQAAIIDVYVTAGNSYGIMTGGIDLAFRNRFGFHIQDQIQEEIFFYRRQKGLAVGEAIHINLLESDQKLIYIPTMVIPLDVKNTENARFAFGAALFEAKKLQRMTLKPLTIACPGLCTLTGRMPPEQAASQMLQGYKDFIWNYNNENRADS